MSQGVVSSSLTRGTHTYVFIWFMDKNLTFKEIAKNSILVKGMGQTADLSEEIGNNNVERLAQLGLIQTSDGKFSLTEQGFKLIEVFNR